jgi:hypothetical protein
MRSTSRRRSTLASQQSLLAIALLLLVFCKPVPAVSWGQRIGGLGHAIKDAALGTADPRLWDIVDAGDAASTSNSPSGKPHTPDARSSLQDSDSKSSQQQLAAGLKTASAASPATAAIALNEAFTHAQQLIDQALTAVLDQQMPGPAEEGFKQALAAFLQAETHLRDWGLALLNPAQAANPNPSTLPAAAGSGESAEQLRQNGVDQLRVVLQQLQALLPQEAGSNHAAAAGAAPTAYASCMAASTRGSTAASSGPGSPADDILASLTCLEQLTSGLSAAGDAGSDGSASAGASDSNAAAAREAASDADAGTGTQFILYGLWCPALVLCCRVHVASDCVHLPSWCSTSEQISCRTGFIQVSRW